MGWAIVGPGTAAKCGTFEASEKLPFEVRRDELRGKVVEFWDNLNAGAFGFIPDLVVVEMPMSPRINPALRMNILLQGELEFVAWQNGVRHESARPDQWHALVTKLTGLAFEKQHSQELASEIMGYSVKQDAADAFWIAQWGLCR